jgi:hypothetical protein
MGNGELGIGNWEWGMGNWELAASTLLSRIFMFAENRCISNFRDWGCKNIKKRQLPAAFTNSMSEKLRN